MVSIDDFVVKASSTHSGTAQNILNYIKKDLGNTFESSLEMRPWVQIDMVEGRFVKSVTIHGNEPSKLTSIYITISTSGTFKRTNHF